MAKETEFEHPPRGHIAPLVYDSVAKKWYAIKGSGYDYLQVAVVSTPANVEVKQTNPADLRIAQHQYDGATWRKSNLLWGYNDRWIENLGGTQSNAGMYSATTTEVSEGYVYILQLLSIRNISSAGGTTLLRVLPETGSYVFLWAPSRLKFEPLLWTGELCLKAGDTVRVTMGSCGDGDTIEAVAWGYKLKVDM